jgi:hypothetical protein
MDSEVAACGSDPECRRALARPLLLGHGLVADDVLAQYVLKLL